MSNDTFNNFLESIKHTNPTVIESIQKAYAMCENNQRTPLDESWSVKTVYKATELLNNGAMPPVDYIKQLINTSHSKEEEVEKIINKYISIDASGLADALSHLFNA